MRGRNREGPDEHPLEDFLYLLSAPDVRHVLETRWDVTRLGPIAKDVELIALAWPMFVLSQCAYLWQSRRRGGDLEWAYIEDPTFVADLLSAVTRACESHSKLPASKWGWERIAQELPLSLRERGDPRDPYFALSEPEDDLTDSERFGEKVSWDFLLGVAKELGCGSDPLAPVSPPLLTIENFRRRIIEALDGMEERRNHWDAHLDALRKLPSDWMEGGGFCVKWGE